MLETLNLDIATYSMKELEGLFQLTFPYGADAINKKKQILLNALLSDKNINENNKQNINNFIDESASYLLKSISSINVTSEQLNTKRVISSFDDTPINKIENQSSDHFIIQKPSTLAGLNSNPLNGLVADQNGAPPGIINPLNIRTIKRALNIDTRFRPNYYNSISTDLLVNIPYKFENVINMRLSSIEIPTTSYSTSEANGNNRFVVFYGENKTSVPIVIPDGNYSKGFSNTLRADPIEQAINNVLAMTELWKPPLCLRYIVDRTSGKSIFSQSKEIEGYEPTYFGITFNVGSDNTWSDNEPLPMKCGWNLGFRLGNYKSPNGESIVSEGICLIRGPQYIYLCIDEYANNVNNYFISCFSESINNNNILARINLSLIQQYNGIYQMGQDDGYYTQLNRSRNYFGPINISKLKISLYDEYGRILNLNNMDWSLSLIFECIYN